MPTISIHIFLIFLVITFNSFSYSTYYCLCDFSLLQESSLYPALFVRFNISNFSYFLYSRRIFGHFSTFSYIFIIWISSTSITSQHFIFSGSTLHTFFLTQSLLHLWWVLPFICFVMFPFEQDPIFFIWTHWTWWHPHFWCPKSSSLK